MELKNVNKEIAIKLEKLGFDWELNRTGTKCFLYSDKDIKSIISIALDIALTKLPVDVKTIQAPTQSLVIKWLRDIKYVKIGIEYNWHYAKYQFRIGIVGSITTDIKFYDNYEDAEEKAIEKAIELLS
jgi:hypothetical protein